MEHDTRTFGNSAQGVISNMNRQAGLFSDQGVESAKQGTASGKHQAPVDEVGRQFRRTTLLGVTHGFHNSGYRLHKGFTDFLRRNDQGFR